MSKLNNNVENQQYSFPSSGMNCLKCYTCGWEKVCTEEVTMDMEKECPATTTACEKTLESMGNL